MLPTSSGTSLYSMYIVKFTCHHYLQGELNGRRGMVPSNFVEVITDNKVDGEDVEVFAASEEDMQRASQIIKVWIVVEHLVD